VRRGNGSNHVPSKCAAIAQQGGDGRRASSGGEFVHGELMREEDCGERERDEESAFG